MFFYLLVMSVWFNGKVKVVLQQFTVVAPSSLNIKSNVRLLNRSTFAALPWWACRTISASLQVPTCNYLHFILPLHVFYIIRRYTTDPHDARRDWRAFSIALQKTLTFKSKTEYLVTLKAVESRPPPPPTSCSQLIDDGDCNSLTPASRMAVTEHFALSLRALFIHFLLGRR